MTSTAVVMVFFFLLFKESVVLTKIENWRPLLQAISETSVHCTVLLLVVTSLF
jgi:hypothetical protein